VWVWVRLSVCKHVFVVYVVECAELRAPVGQQELTTPATV
jgi:hypothetical protein